MLENDPLALDAEFRSIFDEGSVSQDLTKWDVPCLIYSGEEDKMHEKPNGPQRRSRAPRSSRSQATPHFSAERVADQLLPRVLELFRSAAP